jgi:hypothetical protein
MATLDAVAAVAHLAGAFSRLSARNTAARRSSRANRKKRTRDDKEAYKGRNVGALLLPSHIKDWRRIATR